MPAPDLTEFMDDGDLVGKVRDALKRRKSFKIETLADTLDVSPRRVREAVACLQQAGYRIPPEAEGAIELVRVPPDRDTIVHQLPLALLDGERVRLGVISDTHLSSHESALAELELAYDYFEREEISTVLHAGDWCDGVGIYREQHNEIEHHTFEAQVDHLVERFPKRAGIVTDGICGNHDIEGNFGRVGADPLLALSHRRDDIRHLGAYSAWVELPNGALIHLLHGKGSMSYAYSYKAQKLADGYAAGRKPNALIVGHWHVRADMQARGVQILFPGCFQWRSKFMERLALQPAVGFHVIDAQLGDDGSIVEWLPRWKPFWEGRVLAA